MKKPEITEGQWKWIVHDESLGSLVGRRDERDHVLSVSPCKNCRASNKNPINNCLGPSKADAQAISAVPVMIKELIRSHYSLRGIIDQWDNLTEQQIAYLKVRLDDTNEALKKAGCTE